MQKTFSENWCFETILFMAVNFFIAPKKDGKINGFRRNRRIRNNQSILNNRRFLNNLNNRIFPSSLLFNLYFLRLCVCTCCADSKRSVSDLRFNFYFLRLCVCTCYADSKCSVSDLRFNFSIFQSFNLPWGGGINQYTRILCKEPKLQGCGYLFLFGCFQG